MSDRVGQPRVRRDFDPGEIVMFGAKTAIVALAIVAATVFVIGDIEDRIASRIAGMRVGGGEFWQKIDREVARAADPESIPAKKKEQLIGQIKAVSANWAPFVRAVIDGANAAEPKR